MVEWIWGWEAEVRSKVLARIWWRQSWRITNEEDQGDIFCTLVSAQFANPHSWKSTKTENIKHDGFKNLPNNSIPKLRHNCVCLSEHSLLGVFVPHYVGKVTDLLFWGFNSSPTSELLQWSTSDVFTDLWKTRKTHFKLTNKAAADLSPGTPAGE